MEILNDYPQYIQLFAVGFLWISLHCAGMCGPIVLGLDLGGNLKYKGDENVSRSSRLIHSLVSLTAYQSGRSVVYAIAGALAGWGGQMLQNLFRDLTKSTGLIVAVIILLVGFAKLLGWGMNFEFSSTNKFGRLMIIFTKKAQSFNDAKQKFFLGIILGFLPCMITFWVLGLAASTQSMLHGAILMVLLVWMTSFVIYGFGLVPGFLTVRNHALREKFLSGFLIMSGIWLGLISAGANDWIGHASFAFVLGGKGYTIMFW